MWVNLFLDFLLFRESIIFANNILYWLTLWYILKLGTVYTWFLFVCLSKWILKLFCQSLEKKKVTAKICISMRGAERSSSNNWDILPPDGYEWGSEPNLIWLKNRATWHFLCFVEQIILMTFFMLLFLSRLLSCMSSSRGPHTLPPPTVPVVSAQSQPAVQGSLLTDCQSEDSGKKVSSARKICP